MRVRLSLVCSLLLLAACGDRIIGSTAEPDGGLSAAQTDEQLERYAKDLAGTWHGMSDDNNVTVAVEFKPGDLPRAGTVYSEVQTDCPVGVPRVFLPPACSEPSPGQRVIPPTIWTAEYWLLKVQGGKATVAVLPDPDELSGFTFTCDYIPAQPILDCSIKIGGVTFAQVLLHPDTKPR